MVVVKLQWRGWRVEECRVTCAPPLPQGRVAVTSLTPDHHHWRQHQHQHQQQPASSLPARLSHPIIIDAVIMNGDEKYERSEMKLTKHSSMFRSWKGWWRARRWARLSFQTSPQVIIIQCQCANDNWWSNNFDITINSRQDPWFFWTWRGVLGWHLFLQGDTKYIFLTFKLFWLVFLWRMGRLFQTSIGHFSWTPKSNTPL